MVGNGCVLVERRKERSMNVEEVQCGQVCNSWG